jgi:phospholipid transport system substrate-binding protein
VIEPTMKKILAELLSLLVVLGCSLPLEQPDSPALERLKTHIASLQQVLGDPALAGNERLFSRRRLERAILQQLFDFREMSLRALGANARRYSDRMGEFTPLFVDFLEHAYMGTLEENGDARIRYVRQIGEGEDVEIDTRTRLRDGSEYSVSYKLYLGPAGWRVYDVVVEGVDLVENYRSQFDRVLGKKSFDELLEDLRGKKDKLTDAQDQKENALRPADGG